MGIFDTVDLFTVYGVRIAVRDRLMGGVPMNPAVVEGWLRSRAGLTEREELRRLTLKTLIEMGHEMPAEATDDEIDGALKKIAGIKNTVGFKRDENGLYLESRCVKAGLKESVNILFAGEKWGATRKGPKSFFAERVFVNPTKISLGRAQPDGVELFIGHVTGPTGARSTLTYHEYVQAPVLEFELLVCRDAVAHEVWPEIWRHLQENGLGALRSQDFGRFDIEAWEKGGVRALPEAQRQIGGEYANARDLAALADEDAA
jgi:hypothetical protein